MGHVHVRKLRLRGFLTASAAATAFFIWTGTAQAAIPAGGTIGPATPSVSWQGQFFAAGAISDPTLCPPAAGDPLNVVCDHFSLTVTAAGNVTVTITWPSADDDFDLFVFDAANNEVANSQNIGTTSEEVTFAATAQTYEVRVIPFFVVASDYSGTATFAGAGGGGGEGGDGGVIDPPVWISDARVVEGALGTTDAVFTLTLGWAAPVPATVNYVTVDGTADSATDYLPRTGEAVFAPGETLTTIRVPVVGDNDVEPNETFIVDLFVGTPAVVKIYDGEGVGTIRDDDTRRRVRGSGTLGLLGDGSFVFSAAENRWGKIQYRDGDGLRFRSTRITSALFTDLSRSVRLEGNGYHAGQAVTFVLEVADNGLGALDTFLLTLSDGTQASGPLAGGNVEYLS
jgi:hypothetical protein